MARLPLWQDSWDQAEDAWDFRAQEAARQHPLKTLKSLPQIVGITEDTAKNLKWKSLKWMLQKDDKGEVKKGFLKHPFKYTWALLKSAWQSKPYKRSGDFFLYGVNTLKDFETALQDPQSILVLGFSYCHKPFECPSGRFTDQCINNPDSLVCQQCFIGKCVDAGQAKKTFPLFIPTIHYIGGKIFDIVHQHPNQKVLFMITACEMTLEMFGDWGNMVNIQGVGIRLDGRICNTMKAFELSERGIKPGLTIVLDKTKKEMLHLIRLRQQSIKKGNV